MRIVVNESAIKQGCPEDRLFDVWHIVHALEAPQSQKQVDSDVHYALTELGLA
mgnify:FL=1